MRTSVLVSTAAFAVVLLSAVPAGAHAEISPESVPAAQATAVTLSLENESSDAGTVQVDLHFPEGTPVELAATPTAPGWTVEVKGGTVPGPVTDVIWTRPTASPDDDPTLPLTLGPFPKGAARLQFKVLQTYSNGAVDRWIEDWPKGQPEPDMPGPVLEVTGPAPTTAAAPTTLAPTSSAPDTTASAPTSAAPADDDSDDSNTGVIIGAIAAIAVIGGATAYFVTRRRRA